MTLCAEHCLIFHRIFILASRVFIDEILPLANDSYYFQNTRKGGRKRITRNSTIHTPCHHFTPVRQQFLTLFPGLCPWIKQTNDPSPLENGDIIYECPPM